MSKKSSKLIKDMTPYLEEFLEDDGMIFSRFPVSITKSKVITITIERHKDGDKCATPKD